MLLQSLAMVIFGKFSSKNTTSILTISHNIILITLSTLLLLEAADGKSRGWAPSSRFNACTRRVPKTFNRAPTHCYALVSLGPTPTH